MWLMTRHGFYSIVDKGEETHVRARERGDLENLLPFFKLFTAQPPVIVPTPPADYAFRIILKGERQSRQAIIGGVLGELGEDIDYPNFKGEVDKRPDQRRKPYHEVWRVLARALGSYGRAGR